MEPPSPPATDSAGARSSKKLIVFSVCGVAATVCIAALLLLNPNEQPAQAPDIGKTGGPVQGITASQLRDFREAHELFVKDFQPADGLGPLFNRKSCASCHGRPGTDGGDGQELNRTSVVRIARRVPNGKYAAVSYGPQVAEALNVEDIDTLDREAGPVLAVRSITNEYGKLFPPGTSLPPPRIPLNAEYMSFRHAPALFGAGLVDAIADQTLIDLARKQKAEHGGQTFGKAVQAANPLPGGNQIGRFGLKSQHPSVFSFSAEAMHVEMGVTTPLHPRAKSPTGLGNFAPAISKALPPDPNDDGSVLSKLAWYVSLLSPPERGPITNDVLAGEKTFNLIGCAECHVAELKTASQAKVPAFGGTKLQVKFKDVPVSAVSEQPVESAGGVKITEVKALENRTIHPYSDFLVHKMGKKLADGIAQGEADGGEWRTTPLWGLRSRRFFLHDGRARDLEAAIREHGGQAATSVERFEHLDSATRRNLIQFLQSL